MITALLLSLSVPDGDAIHGEAMRKGQAWASAPISQQCLDEVAARTDETANSQRQRELATFKAQTLAGIMAQIVEASDNISQLTISEQQSLNARLAAGTITKAEHEENLRINSVKIEAGSRVISQMMTDYPSCDFFRLYPASPVVQGARSMLKAER